MRAELERGTGIGGGVAERLSDTTSRAETYFGRKQDCYKQTEERVRQSGTQSLGVAANAGTLSDQRNHAQGELTTVQPDTESGHH